MGPDDYIEPNLIAIIDWVGLLIYLTTSLSKLFNKFKH